MSTPRVSTPARCLQVGQEQQHDSSTHQLQGHTDTVSMGLPALLENCACSFDAASWLQVATVAFNGPGTLVATGGLDGEPGRETAASSLSKLGLL